MTPVAPLMILDVSSVTRINHDSFFAAGAICGDAGVPLFVAGATFVEIWVDSRS